MFDRRVRCHLHNTSQTRWRLHTFFFSSVCQKQGSCEKQFWLCQAGTEHKFTVLAVDAFSAKTLQPNSLEEVGQHSPIQLLSTWIMSIITKITSLTHCNIFPTIFWILLFELLNEYWSSKGVCYRGIILFTPQGSKVCSYVIKYIKSEWPNQNKKQS